jgi:hypothetical protein
MCKLSLEDWGEIYWGLTEGQIIKESTLKKFDAYLEELGVTQEMKANRRPRRPE